MAAVPPAPVGLPGAVALAAPEIPEDLDYALTLIGITIPAQRVRIVEREGLTTIADLGLFQSKEIETMATRYMKLPQLQRIDFGLLRLKRLKAVAHWARKQKRSNIPVDHHDLTAEVLVEMIEEMNLDEADYTLSTEKLYPSKFDAKKFKVWKTSYLNYLDSQKGENGVPLSYVVRPVDVDPASAVDDQQRLIWSTPLAGAAFTKDNRAVYQIMKSLMLNTEGWAWFQDATESDG